LRAFDRIDPKTTALGVEQAWAQFTREPFEIVVTDVALPGTDGIELCRRIRQQRSQLQTGIITLTGLTLTPSRSSS